MTPSWRPKPLIAALLNLNAGLGHIYSGQIGLGALVLVATLVEGLGLLIASCYVESRVLHLTALAVGLAIHFVGLPILGYVVARRTEPAAKRWYQRWYSLLLIYLTCYFGLLLLIGAGGLPFIRAYRVPTISMQPTLLLDDRVLTVSNHNDTLHRGDVVVAAMYQQQLHIRRVVGIPGDTVELRGFRAFINGQPELPGPGPCRYSTNMDPNWGPVTVPEGQYALFGDCRDNAVDTRFLGFATRDQIVRRVAWIYWSSDANGLRFDRIGLSVH
jgi:signal peptidase I